ncbi:hypothetical protein EW026_g4895 [Hermanssonia centrifuga]|uniref:Uncharacterized protein n=1 Tax=Hermanssonia centrifuga TaxID=98765 RepID=A0A4S4KFT0_9APHY|nr:hypothetical protein EW026_g4895 [Hermanssonia centrifuga]
MASNTIYQTPPLAGRPPFATDDDHIYGQQTQALTPRRRRSPSPDPNSRTSAYNVYDQYLEGSNRDSGVGALGMGMMNVDMDDDDDPFDDSHRPTPKQQPIPLAAPRPGYAAPVSALNLSRPSPAASPDGRQPSPSQMSQIPKPLMLVSSLNGPTSPRLPSPASMNVPSTPHPLPPTMTPITPAFVRPTKVGDDREVKFAATQPILRGEKEETLLPQRGEKGDDFWRRFSMVIKEENMRAPTEKTSPWLRETQSGATRLSRWIWVIGLGLLLCIAGGIGLGLWIARGDQPHNAPTAIGGSANEKLLSSSAANPVVTEGGVVTTSFHVSPTHTVARRVDFGEPLPTYTAVASMPTNFGSDTYVIRPVQPSRHRRVSQRLNRTKD